MEEKSLFGNLFNKLKTGLTKTRDGLTDKINEVLKIAITIDEDLYEELDKNTSTQKATAFNKLEINIF